MKWIQLMRVAVHARRPWLQLFAGMLIIAQLLICTRLIVATEKTMLFLLWNLMLALIPLAISSLMLHMPPSNIRRMAGVVWLLFFPNAPYLLTDFIHLSYGNLRHFWLDALTITWFAVTGLLAALVSLNDIARMMESRLSSKRSSLVIAGICVLTGFGIYLGRYLRFNSWDILTEPFSLFSEIVHRFIDPFHHPRTWLVSLIFGALLFFLLKGIRLLSAEMQKNYL